MERFRFFFLLPRQKQQRAPGGQYGLEQAARQPGGERHNEKQQCQDQNKPGQPEAVVPGGDFLRCMVKPPFVSELCAILCRAVPIVCERNVVHCYRQITEELLC